MKKSFAAAAAVILCLVLVLGLTACGAASAAPAGTAVSAEAQPEVTVSASASVTLVPDRAMVRFGVTTQEATAQEAQDRNAGDVKKVTDTLTALGVEEKSICTDSYSLYPVYDWSGTSEEPRITGYCASTSMTVKDQEIPDLGKLLSAVVEAGVNDIDSVRFLCSGYDEAYRQALAKAVEESRGEAEALAAAAGKKLGDAVTITEGWQDTSARYGEYADASKAEAAFDDASGPVFQPGETEITANVTVTYRMR